MKKKLSIVMALILCCGIGGYAAIPNQSQFELEANANAVLDGVGDDWANVVPLILPGAGASVSTFVADGSGNATIFTTGGSKDILDINQWAWKNQLGGLPDKDNITNAYAAGYVSNTGELVVYFGMDRFANSGDAQMGFWFFQKQVGLGVAGNFVGADGVTPATHAVGDILVLVNATNGGAVLTGAVYEWVGGAEGIHLLASSTDVHCGSNTTPNFCATFNSSSQTAPWAYVPKAGTPGVFPAFSFFEGGISITTALGGVSECFSSFLAETRSSQSASATLKDFALGSFNTCKMDIAKDCPAVSFNPTTGLLDYSYNVTVANSGLGTLYDIVVNDSASGGYTNTFNLASLATGASHVFSSTFSLAPGLGSPNPPTNTADAIAAPSSGGVQSVTAGPVSATCPQVSYDANLTVSKSCETRLEVQGDRVVVKVAIAGEVCNVPPGPGARDIASPIDNILLTDDPAIPPISVGTLDPGACQTYSSFYFPGTLFGGSDLPHEQRYEDTILAVGTNRYNGVQKQNTASANCPLCP